MSICWRDMENECELSNCCYRASSKAVFEYWKFSNSDKWKKMVEQELDRETGIRAYIKTLEKDIEPIMKMTEGLVIALPVDVTIKRKIIKDLKEITGDE